MAKVLIIADDLTGSNATGARFSRAGFRAATLSPEHVSQRMADFDVVTVNTNSRHLSVGQAGQEVYNAVHGAGIVDLVVKRTDTTLRGNIGAEVAAARQAMLDLWPGENIKVLMVPAFPESGRATINGFQHLHGQLLENTELAHDPQNPISTSWVADILNQQTDLTTSNVLLNEVCGPRDAFVKKLANLDTDVVICDAYNGDHLHDIAEAAAEVTRSHGVRWLCVDPGPTGALLATELGLGAQTSQAGPVLAVVGSVTHVTMEQLQVFASDQEHVLVQVSPQELFSGNASELVERLRTAITSVNFPQTVVIQTAKAAGGDDVIGLAERKQLPGLLAKVVLAAIKQAPVSGLYTTGGDITAAILETTKASAFEVVEEVIPLAVLGTNSGGPYNGLPVVTKGGLIGDDSAMVQCIEALKSFIHAQQTRITTELD